MITSGYQKPETGNQKSEGNVAIAAQRFWRCGF
jgi:hypothetical protein